MQFTHARKTRAVLFAVVIAVAGASPAFAASSSSGVSESLSIPSTIELTGVPATATYVQGTCAAGPCLPTDYAYLVNWSALTNNATGLTARVSGTALSVGAATIPTSARHLSVGTAAGWTLADPDGFYDTINGTPAAIGSTAANGAVSIGMEPVLRVDAAAAAGAYSGTFTIAVETNP